MEKFRTALRGRLLLRMLIMLLCSRVVQMKSYTLDSHATSGKELLNVAISVHGAVGKYQN